MEPDETSKRIIELRSRMDLMIGWLSQHPGSVLKLAEAFVALRDRPARLEDLPIVESVPLQQEPDNSILF